LRNEVADASCGQIDNIMQVHSLNPRGMAAHNALYQSAMAGTRSLRKVDRELVAFVVSLTNDCHY
jgi:alkylhydroperoxidase family enzyme